LAELAVVVIKTIKVIINFFIAPAYNTDTLLARIFLMAPLARAEDNYNPSATICLVVEKMVSMETILKSR
jgi:hypothetical protein